MQNNYQNIPAELKAIRAWCIWRYEDIGATKATKVPYNARNHEHASTDDPNTWSSFVEAVNRAITDKFDGIGFMFSDNDPYTFIDLDDPTKLPNGQPNPNYAADMERQVNIFKEFNSYSEVSPSGAGLHIIVKGKVPVGRKRSFIEIYSNKRYATFTGNVYSDKPIEYQQDALMQLWEQMGSVPSTYIFNGNDAETQTDEQIINQSINAVNGDKFKTLLEGRWADIYPSQSEADLAFINIIAFYTQNKKQIERIFKQSPLGQREKARRSDYVGWMINKAFDNMLPSLDFDGFKNALDLKIAQSNNSPQLSLPMVLPEESEKPIQSTIPIPPGLLGELAQFIYQAAPRPVPEIALAGAIGLMAGICGRAYNVSATGLNQYILLIANTGAGKEAMALGIDKLMNTIRMQVPTSASFIGPAEIASGQALVKELSNRNCFVSILGEFGLRLQSMSNPNGNGAEISLRRILLDLYNKSGHGTTFRGSIYADKDKNIPETYSPSFSILGESTPERFYGVLNEDMIAEGLLPRFMLIEYAGPVPNLSKHFATVQPPFPLIEKLASLVANCETVMHGKKVINVELNADAEKLSDQFERHCTTQLNRTNKEVTRQLWNRAHIKALKIAATIAVGINMINPIIAPEYLIWAINIVNSDIKTLSAKFESGEIGNSSNESKQIDEVCKMIKRYFAEGEAKAKSYQVSERLYNARVIPYSYITKRLMAQSTFRGDRLGATVAIKRTIQTMMDSDRLREIGKLEMVNRFGTVQRAFIVSDLNIVA